MPRIFDNLEQHLLPALQHTLQHAYRADFCVGYFNLRGWQALDAAIQTWSGGPDHCCRLLIGMQRLPQTELHNFYHFPKPIEDPLDQQTVLRLKRQLAEEFRAQLALGIANNNDEQGLRRLVHQLEQKQVIVKLFLRHRLHAKLYLLFRHDNDNPITGYLGSSNLTLAGLSHQGELNIDVLDHDACHKLAKWFQDRWQDRWCLDISQDLLHLIRTSWAREEPILPYHLYLKMAYHLSQEARLGLTEFRVPREFENILFDFQTTAVQIAAHHLNKRGGVLLGDVVGLGKTLMATALIRIFEDDYDLETLILCPKNLVTMWETYRDEYRLRAKVLSISQVHRLKDFRRYRLVVIDESHNLRHQAGQRYQAILEYLRNNDSKVILLTATPYNKTYLDLASQLHLFIAPDANIGIRPEILLRELGGVAEFNRKYQCSIHSLTAFEKSPHPDDWRDLMRLYLVRRTRSFIQEHYAQKDDNQRPYLTLPNGERRYFPLRQPKTITFVENPQYANLYAVSVVDLINRLHLPRYGLGNYVAPLPTSPPNQEDAKILQNLSRAGKRLMGFCRTNLFKRLESSGHSFLLSIEHHILRNEVFLYALNHGQPVPIGTQDADWLTMQDTDQEDLDAGSENLVEQVYQRYATTFRKHFQWLPSHFFLPMLAHHLQADNVSLRTILQQSGVWQPSQDAKLNELRRLLTQCHAAEKVLVFTQFADTAHYLVKQLQGEIPNLAEVTGAVENPTALAHRFSPQSNPRHLTPKSSAVAPELRVLIATDVLSEGQNLQDCHIIINYDLPWAIIRLVQRAGRVDRIGQTADRIFCYSFLPAAGVEKIIQLRARVAQRLRENAEVVGTDETFFEEDSLNTQRWQDLYNEAAGILDDDDKDIDLSSYAYQIWHQAIQQDPKLEALIPSLPAQSYTAKSAPAGAAKGVLVYLRTAEGNDALAWLDETGQAVTESQLAILNAAYCLPTTPALPRQDHHHEWVKLGVERLLQEEKQTGGQLGKQTGARYRTYERLKNYVQQRGKLLESPALPKAIDLLYRYPLRHSARETLTRQLRVGIRDDTLLELVVTLYEADQLCVISEEDVVQEAQIVCSMGMV